MNNVQAAALAALAAVTGSPVFGSPSTPPAAKAPHNPPACACIKAPCSCNHGTSEQKPDVITPQLGSSSQTADPLFCQNDSTLLDAPYYCEPCGLNFSIPTVVAVNRHGQPFGYTVTLVDSNSGMATKWTVTHPKQYVQGAADNLIAWGSNSWASGNNFTATGFAGKMLKSPKINNLGVSNHVHTLQNVTRLTGGFWIDFTTGANFETAMEITIDTRGIRSWGDQSALDRSVTVAVPRDIVTEGSLLVLYPYREPELDMRAQCMWADVTPPSPPGPGYVYNINGVEPRVTTQVELITPGSDAARRAWDIIRYFNPLHARIVGGR